MPYQVNMTANDEGFTDAGLESVLLECAAAESPSLRVRRADNGSLELHNPQGLLVTLCPAGAEPYDYLLVDFEQKVARDDSPQVRVLAEVAEKLDLSILELESRLEYSPHQWAVVRGKYHAPDPARQEEVRRLDLEREIQFYAGQGYPYSPEDAATLAAALENVTDEALQRAARGIRDRKENEVKLAESTRKRPYADTPEPPKWWPFKKRQ